MPSFDIVSTVELHQFTNTVDQCNRVIDTRFDFKGVNAKYDQNELSVVVIAEADFQLKQMIEILTTALIKNEINPKAMSVGDVEGSGKQIKQTVTMQNGLETTTSKAIVKLIKEQKSKTKAQIQGEQVRIVGKKRDELQEVIALLKKSKIDQALQFTNFRD
jgi:cyclic-di-GMP-binding protein